MVEPEDPLAPSLWCPPRIAISQSASARQEVQQNISYRNPAKPHPRRTQGFANSIPAHCDITAEAQPWNLECKGRGLWIEVIKFVPYIPSSDWLRDFILSPSPPLTTTTVITNHQPSESIPYFARLVGPSLSSLIYWSFIRSLRFQTQTTALQHPKPPQTLHHAV